jgi:hypothetical protein
METCHRDRTPNRIESACRCNCQDENMYADSSPHSSYHPFRVNIHLGPVDYSILIGPANPRPLPISSPTSSRHPWFPVNDRHCCLAQRASFANMSAHFLTVRSVRSWEAVPIRKLKSCVCPAKSIVCLMRTRSNKRKRSSSIILSASSLGDVTSQFSCSVGSVDPFHGSRRWSDADKPDSKPWANPAPAQEFDSGIECQSVNQKTQKYKDTEDSLIVLVFKWKLSTRDILSIETSVDIRTVQNWT